MSEQETERLNLSGCTEVIGEQAETLFDFARKLGLVSELEKSIYIPGDFYFFIFFAALWFFSHGS